MSQSQSIVEATILILSLLTQASLQFKNVIQQGSRTVGGRRSHFLLIETGLVVLHALNGLQERKR
jgi:hypothetical protein